MGRETVGIERRRGDNTALKKGRFVGIRIRHVLHSCGTRMHISSVKSESYVY